MCEYADVQIKKSKHLKSKHLHIRTSKITPRLPGRRR
jgi:hypothetical protein